MLASQPSLLFTGCTFRQGFSLKNAELHGELLFDAVRMLGSSHQYIVSVLRLEGAHIDGDVQIRRSFLNVPVNLSGAKIRGSISFAGVEIRGIIDGCVATDLRPALLSLPF